MDIADIDAAEDLEGDAEASAGTDSDEEFVQNHNDMRMKNVIDDELNAENAARSASDSD